MKRMFLAMSFAVTASIASAAEPYQLNSSEIESVEVGVRSKLIDPESARFDGLGAARSSRGDVSVCGYVNAKNSFGGYIGKRGFFGTFRDDGFELRVIAQDGDTASQVENRCGLFGIW